MVARKKAKVRRTAKAAPTGREFAVVLEDLRANFAVFGEALEGLREHMDESFETLEGEVGLLKVAVSEHGRELKGLRSSVERIETKLEQKVDRDEVAAVVRAVMRQPSH